MQVHAHSWLELVDAEPLRLRAPLVNGFYDVVGGRLDPLPVAESDAKDGLLPVVLDRDDAGDAVSVIHLAPDLIAVDELADRHHSVWRRDECVVRLACRALRLLLEPDVEPDGRVEGRELVHEDELQLVLEALSLLVVREVAALAAPGADRRDDAADHLLDAALPVGRAHAPAEVLLPDDVRGRLRPELREFNALLLEHGLALARDEGVARLPFDLVERVAPGDREVAADAELGAVVDDEIRRRFGSVLGGLGVVGGRHSYPSRLAFQVDCGDRRLVTAPDVTGAVTAEAEAASGARAATGSRSCRPRRRGGERRRPRG